MNSEQAAEYNQYESQKPTKPTKKEKKAESVQLDRLWKQAMKERD